MNLQKLAIIALLFFFIVGTTNGQQVIAVSDFGVKPNSYLNASPGIQKAIKACGDKINVTLQLPGGRIDLWPEGAFKKELYISNSTEDDTLSKVKNIGFLLEGMQNFTIEGNNTLVMLHGKMESFAFINCKDILLKNIRFDYERPTMSELTITALTDEEAKVEIHPDTKFVIENGKMAFYGEGWKSISLHTISYSPKKELMKYSSFSPFLQCEAIQTGCREVTFKGDFTKMRNQVGDVLTIRDPYRDNSGGFISLCKNIRLENVKMHYTHGLGIVSQFSENISLFKVIAAPRENSGRIIASFADCFHFSGCKGIINIDSCFTSGAHDDPINIHGTHLQITATDANSKLTVKFMHVQTYGFEAFFAGDSIAFINSQTLMPLGYAKLKSARLINKRDMELEVEGALPKNAQIGNCIENLTWTPEVVIRNSRFERTTTRGLLITTRRKVLIENNTFYHTGMHAILIADDATSWYESGPMQDVTIRKNTFIECGYNQAPNGYVIAIAPENHQMIPGKMVHRNIRIVDNVFQVDDYPILTARSTENLIFTGNKIIRTDSISPVRKQRPSFYLNGCTKVKIKGNESTGFCHLMIQTEHMKKNDMKTDLKDVSSTK
jgi:hypothetical protein